MFVAVLPIVLLKLFVTCAQTGYNHSKATAKGVRKRASFSAFDIWEDEMMDDRLFLQMLATLSLFLDEVKESLEALDSFLILSYE